MFGLTLRRNTTLKHGLMLAYNQFTASAAVRSQVAGGQPVGGLGRKGAQRLVILETDGMANQATSAGFTNAGAYSSYYNLGPADGVTCGGLRVFL